LFHLKERALGKLSEQFFDIGFVRDGFINGEPVDGELVESVEPPRELLSKPERSTKAQPNRLSNCRGQLPNFQEKST